MARCVTISAAEFARLTSEQQRTEQTKQANCLLGLSLSGDKLTQAESDFVSRTLTKRIPSIETSALATITGTAVENVKAGLSAITAPLTRNLLLPIIIVLALFLLIQSGAFRKA